MIQLLNIEKYYTITRDGEIISKRNNKPLRPYISKSGYYTVDLYLDGKKIKQMVHRLVALKYIHCDNQLKNTVNHKDGNKLNNNLNNLNNTSLIKKNNNHSIETERNLTTNFDRNLMLSKTNLKFSYRHGRCFLFQETFLKLNIFQSLELFLISFLYPLIFGYRKNHQQNHHTSDI